MWCIAAASSLDLAIMASAWPWNVARILKALCSIWEPNCTPFHAAPTAPATDTRPVSLPEREANAEPNAEADRAPLAPSVSNDWPRATTWAWPVLASTET